MARGPRRSRTAGVLTETVDLVDRAVATSAGAGFRFDARPVYASVRSSDRTQSVAIPHGERHGADSDRSDALSTAFSLMSLSRIQDIVAVRLNVQARIIDPRWNFDRVWA